MLYALLESVNLMLLKLLGAIGDLEDYLSKANWIAVQSRHLREIINLIWLIFAIQQLLCLMFSQSINLNLVGAWVQKAIGHLEDCLGTVDWVGTQSRQVCMLQASIAQYTQLGQIIFLAKQLGYVEDCYSLWLIIMVGRLWQTKCILYIYNIQNRQEKEAISRHITCSYYGRVYGQVAIQLYVQKTC